MAALSLLTALLVWRLAVDPRHLEHHPSLHGGAPAPAGLGADVEAAPGGSGGSAALQAARAQGVDWRRAWRDAKAVLAIRSFQILVLQGERRMCALLQLLQLLPLPVLLLPLPPAGDACRAAL